MDIRKCPHRIGDSRIVALATIYGDPGSKGTVQRQKRSSENRPEAKHVESKTRDVIAAAHRRLIPNDTHEFCVRVFFYTATFHRLDIDNLCKVVFDACTGVVWNDDRQVIELQARLLRGDDTPRTEVLIAELGEIYIPTRPCAVCAKPYRVYPSQEKRKYCSKQCMRLAFQNGIDTPCSGCGVVLHRAANRVRHSKRGFYCSSECLSKSTTLILTCAHCSATFEKPQSVAARRPCKYCSPACGAAAARARKIVTKSGCGTCRVCGARTSRKEYTRCNPCRIATGRRSK